MTTIAHPVGAETLRLIRTAAEHDAPTLFHCGDEPLTTPLASRRLPGNAPGDHHPRPHGGYFHVDEAIEVADRLPNVVLETSAMPCPEKVREAVARVGAERVLYASDGPACSPSLEVAKVRLAGLEPEAERAILGERPAHPRPCLVIVDGLRTSSATRSSGTASTGDLLAAMDGVGIDRAVVCPVKPRTYQLAGENERVADAVRQHGGGSSALVASTRCSATRVPRRRRPPSASSAVRAVPPSVGGDVPHRRFAGRPRRRRRAGARRAVVVATGYPWLSEALQVADLARRFPDVTFLMTNGGQLNVSGLGQTDAELALAGNPKLLVLTTGVYREDFLEGVVDRFGAERLVFASSFPLFDTRLELIRARALHIGEHEKAKVLGGNLVTLLDLRSGTV